MTHSNPQVNLEEKDMRELEEIIIEFLSKYDALYEKRIQKLVFYGEIFTAQHFGERLTNSDFMPYHHGPYSRAVTKAITNLRSNERISINPRRRGQQYTTEEEGGEISESKREWIDQIHEDSKNMGTDGLVDFAKDTWLWQNFDHEENIDFDEYIDQVVPSTQAHYRLYKEDRTPASDSRIDEVLM
ncbi:type II toxin-antitoxin system antitoxin SocA domain-containing protein [Halorussus halophilus]|uniref:type II toxin-antitoxin system antitoxin SocA domain-containing protein n=1 Tax=Halorussus halophilus TaxID=2650975 RepID=UPI0013019A63|nr:type II toxin-antitoxin system antitoxin SocA domain-containing protein [Halorussus halophilus]